MIVQINEALDIIDSFMKSPAEMLTIGGCVGTTMLKHVMDTVTAYYSFPQILVIEGCQDYVEMQKRRIPNHIFYGEAMCTMFQEHLDGEDSDLPRFLQREPAMYNTISPAKFNMMKKYPVIIINDIHLIKFSFVHAIRLLGYSGKIISIVDPFDVGVENFTHVPTVVDTLSVISPIQAYARSIIGVETRAVNKLSFNKVRDIKKIPLRAVGKIDDKQYISNDIELVQNIRAKQIQAGFKRNQRVICSSFNINSYKNEDNTVDHMFVKMSMATIINPKPSNGLTTKIRLYNSRNVMFSDITFNQGCLHHQISVLPGNILTTAEAVYHKYENSVLVLTDNGKQLSKRELYSVLRNTNNLAIGRV